MGAETPPLYYIGVVMFDKKDYNANHEIIKRHFDEGKISRERANELTKKVNRMFSTRENEKIIDRLNKQHGR